MCQSDVTLIEILPPSLPFSLPPALPLQVVSTAPSLFPTSLAAPLVSIVLYDSEPLDNLTWSAIATLCELGRFLPVFYLSDTHTHALSLSSPHLSNASSLALVNPEVAARSGGIKAILKGLLKCHVRPSFLTTSVISQLSNAFRRL